MSVQRPGYPNISIKLYEDFDAWLENRFLELASTFTTLTIRDGLYGKNEGMLQFHDTKNLHTKMNGEQIIQISVANANSKNVMTRIYGCKHFAVSVDEKQDNIIAINLEPMHNVENLKFSRAFFTNGTESLQEMIRVIYKDRDLLAPKVEGANVFVPRVPWVSNIKNYMQYVREVGMAVESEQFVFVWEDILGLHVLDYNELIAQEAKNMIVGEPRTIGTYIDELEYPLAWDFIWHTKANQHDRNPLENATFYTHAFNDKAIERVVTGDGTNSVLINRSGGYSDMTYRNGYEEVTRLCTMAQYDGYAETKTTGNFEYTPGQKINFADHKGQVKTDFYVDEVIHEISNNSSITTLYMFTNGKALVPVDPIKVKNEIKEISPDMPTVEPVPKGDAQWDLDRLAIVIEQNATGRKSTGDCALFVRKALEVSQLEHQFSGGLGNANEMPPRLLQLGWYAVGNNINEWKKGDIAVFPKTNTKLGQKYGHVCVWTGYKWVSDFIQRSVNPTSTGQKLPYTIYRAQKGYTQYS